MHRLWILGWLISFSLLGGASTWEQKQLEVSLRQFGHQLLLDYGDSNSRVLPLQQVGDAYRLEFESSFSFEPERLLELTKQYLQNHALADEYLVEVNPCGKEEVIFAFEVSPTAEQEIVPCIGRDQIKSCYSILISFPRLNSRLSEASSPSYAWTWLFVLLILGLVLWMLSRGGKGKEQGKIKVGRFIYHPHRNIIEYQKEEIELTEKEAALLLLFWEHKNELLPRETLLNKVWGDEGDYVGRTLDVFISRLRKKIKSDPSLVIHNVRGQGYRLGWEE